MALLRRRRVGMVLLMALSVAQRVGVTVLPQSAAQRVVVTLRGVRSGVVVVVVVHPRHSLRAVVWVWVWACA